MIIIRRIIPIINFLGRIGWIGQIHWIFYIKILSNKTFVIHHTFHVAKIVED